MAKISRSFWLWSATAIWLGGLLLFAGLGLWSLEAFKIDAENQMINEAGRISAQIAALFSNSDPSLNQARAQAVADAAMEDERLYGIRVDTLDKTLAGLRRNYLWEPVQWDDEITENCVQGMHVIRANGQKTGRVEVWLSPRLSGEEIAQLIAREKQRFFGCALLWTGVFCLLLWHWGEFGRLKRLFNKAELKPGAEKIMQGLASAASNGEPAVLDAGCALINMEASRKFQAHNPDAWLITAGMFRQTFSAGPSLISRLYAEGKIACLCHLGHILEQAAPCIGANPLAKAAEAMQEALKNPDFRASAQPVEKCARILERTLEQLGGNCADKRV